jgi:hypothetical protein
MSNQKQKIIGACQKENLIEIKKEKINFFKELVKKFKDQRIDYIF